MTTNTQIKVVAIGDGFVGKTCLLQALAEKEFHDGYKATIFENNLHTITHNDKSYDLFLIDTAGQEEYENLRTPNYEDCNVCLICFSVSDRTSFENVNTVWLPEIRKSFPTIDIVLIGTKSDQRYDREVIDRMNIAQEVFIDEKAAVSLSQRYFRSQYLECSAKTNDNIRELQKRIVEVYLARQESEKKIGLWKNPFFALINKAFCCNKYC